jgi:hypothetical protein
MLAMLPGVLAFGQADLPAEVTTKSSLSPAEEQAVSEWALSNWAMIDGEAPATARDARRRLVEPLLKAETTANFRIVMDRALGSQLQDAMSGDDVFRGVNAALLSGWIGTDRSVRSLTESVQAGPVAIRFSSVAGLSNAFRVADLGPVAFQAQVGNQAVDALAGVLETADNQSMLDATVKALIEAMAVRESAIAGFGSRAGQRLTAAVGERLNTLPIDDQLGNRLPPLLRAMGEIRSAVTQRRGNLDPAWRDGIMEMYGRTAAMGVRFVRAQSAGSLGGADTDHTRGTIEATLRVAGTMPTLLPLSGAVQDQLNALGLSGHFQAAPSNGGNPFLRATNDLIRLLESQFGLRRDRFSL